MKDQKIAELARPLVNEELKEIVDNYAKGANKDNDRMLQQILEVVDKTRTELVEQGKELTENTTATKNLRAEFDAFRDTINSRDKKLHEKVTDTVSSSITDSIAGAVELATTSVKGKIQVKPHKSILDRILRRKAGDNK